LTSINSAIDAAGEEAPARAFDTLCIVSPGREEDDQKDQDRLAVVRVSEANGSQLEFAAVCDGVTTSPCSERAAEFVAGRVSTLFDLGGIERAAEGLKQMRQELLEKPLRLEPAESAMMTQLVEEIIREKYSRSFQTTVVAVCVKRGPGTMIKAIGCGDSALFIFRDFGRLLYNNVQVANEYEQFNHATPFTAVLPDSFKLTSDNVLFDFNEFDDDVQLLLCSDGLYDCFASFSEIHNWIDEHLPELQTAGSAAACLVELHERLTRRKGDDDITFVLLRPPSAARNPVSVTLSAGIESSNTLGDRQRSRIGSFFRRLRRSPGPAQKPDYEP